ncbi:MAG: hypothetical protein AAF125_18585 [Chloroflexota bacterium]
MQITLHMDEPRENCVLWRFEGFIGVIDYMPPMNDSIGRAMIDPDTDYFVVLDMGAAMPFPNRSFGRVAQPIIGAPPNLKRVVIASTNPLTRLLIAITLGREPLLQDKLRVISNMGAVDAHLA